MYAASPEMDILPQTAVFILYCCLHLFLFHVCFMGTGAASCAFLWIFFLQIKLYDNPFEN